jgi:muramoyltetrapeptide carboxypeptidase LdcA involved in peptidoglycan recycling
MKAHKLQRGDTVGIVSPAWGGAGAYPHRLQRGIAQLEALGLRAKVARHAQNQLGFVSDSAQNRASDLHAMFADPQVKAIIAAIGGDHSCHLLPLLDFDLIRAHPKIFMGYSDITVLNIAIWQATGLTTFNGPAILTDFGEYPAMFEYTRLSMLRTLTQAEAIGRIEPSSQWTEEFLDWWGQKDLERARALEPSAGWSWLKQGCGEGILVGGCLESLQHLRGTSFWPDWRDTILFIETSEEKPSPAEVDGILMDYENMGVFTEIKGLLVGRPIYYTAQEKEQLHEILLERTRRYAFPIIAEMDFGHTAPQFTLPIGCQATIDTQRQWFAITEAAVAG